jgi:lysine-N-methylase
VDRKTYEKFQQFPTGRLGAVVSQFVTITPSTKADALYARIDRAPSGCCAFFGPDRLCAIQKEYGGELLPTTCSVYPRALNVVGGRLEGTLLLSCPEAARNVLLAPDATRVRANLMSGQFRTEDAPYLASNAAGLVHKPYSAFPAVQDLLVTMVRDRARPLWQRLLLIGALCERLDAIATPDQDVEVPAILTDYHRIVHNHELIAEMDSLPTAPRLQLEVILKLSAIRIRDGARSARFAETFKTFIAGIGYENDSTPEDRTKRYREADEQYYRPFCAERPYILENFLENYIYQTLFPFGRAGNPSFTNQRIMDDYVLMATQFAWIEALLIGVAGYHRNAFAEEHVVFVIQSFCRAIEHYPLVLVSINETMRSLKLDSLNGMAVMLKR